MTLSSQLQIDLGLAPMEGVSDLPFRLWMSLASRPRFCSTPFLRVTNTFPKSKIPRSYAPELSELSSYINYQVTPQIMASQTEDFLRVADQVLKDSDFVDLNCGCPSPNAVGSSAGSSLLSTSERFGNFVSHLSQELGNQKLSVKMRTGFKSHDEFSNLIEQIKDLPLKQLGVHGRTRAQRYDGYSRWGAISEASKALSFPVVASGDITSLKSLENNKEYLKGIPAAIIGRGALRNPWIFLELKESTPQTLSKETLIFALASLAVLYHLYITSEDTLFGLVKDGHILESCGTNGHLWKDKFETFASYTGQSPRLEELDIPPYVLGRVKMLWNYLRSSLPEPFFQPKILRSKSLIQFLTGIQNCHWESDKIPLKHNPDLDWVYTSKKKPPAETDSMFH